MLIDSARSASCHISMRGTRVTQVVISSYAARVGIAFWLGHDLAGGNSLDIPISLADANSAVYCQCQCIIALLVSYVEVCAGAVS